MVVKKIIITLYACTSITYFPFRRDKSEEPENIEVNPLTIFYTAIENSKPAIGCQTVKKGGKNYSVSINICD